MIGIYKITNKINNKIYVGQSIDIIERWKQHGYKAFNSNERAYNSAIHLAFRKYGIENFSLEVLEECKIDELDKKEREWIEKLNSLAPNGYNMLPGGQQYRREAKDILCTRCGKVLRKKTKTGLCEQCYKESLYNNLPSAEELVSILKEYKGNFSAAGRYYNVTDNAVRKWCKHYGLPYHSCDYKI